MGNIRWYGGIRMKLIAMVVICCTLLLGGLGAYDTLMQQRNLAAELQKLARVTSLRLAQHLVGPMWDLDRELVDSTLAAEMLEDDIHAIVVWDEGGDGVFSARERGVDGGLVESNGAISGDLFQSTHEVNNEARSIGQVAVFVSKRQLQAQLAKSTIDKLVALAALILVMATVMTLVVNRVVIGPVRRLAKHAEDIGHGDLKQNITAESRDEIGQLAETLQHMQTRLRVAFKRIYARARGK